jgi:hypothetical protein
MRSKQASRFVLVALSALAGGCGGSAGSADPGSTIEAMTLVRGTTSQADLKFFDLCNPIIVKSGQYRRSCHVPDVPPRTRSIRPELAAEQLDKAGALPLGQLDDPLGWADAGDAE